MRGDRGLGTPTRAAGVGRVGQNWPWDMPQLRGLGLNEAKNCSSDFLFQNSFFQI
jgi:hypothetical protein